MRLLPLMLSVLAGALSLVACSSDGASGRPEVVATTGVVADVVREVSGDDAQVAQLVPDSATPHDFELSAQDRLELEQADLLAYSGAGLEAGIPIEDVDAPKWQLAGERARDPHVWMDPTRVARALPSLARKLGEVDPRNARAYRERAARYAGRLRRLDREIHRTLEPIPTARRKLVTSHDALAHFARRYGFEVIATPFPASGAESEPSAARLREVEEAVRDSNVPAVFAEQGDDPRVLRRVAADTGVEVVDQLLVESPGSAGSYGGMLRRDARLIRRALGPG